MENQSKISKERFKELIQQAQALLNISSQELENKYSELIQQIDKETNRNTIEIRLNEENITVTSLINEQKQCTDVYFFFDKIEDEDVFINFLVDYFDYSFKKRIWLLSNCVVKIREMKDILTFHFHKQLYNRQICRKCYTNFFFQNYCKYCFEILI